MDGFYSFFLSRSVKDLLFNWLTETEKSIHWLIQFAEVISSNSLVI